MHYYMRILCIEYKLVSVEYFLDRMKIYELDDLLLNVQYTDKNLLITNRFTALAIAQKLCKKRLKGKDLYELPWDKDTIELDEDDVLANIEAGNKLLDIVNKNIH